MLIQDFLRNGGTIESLLADFAITSRRHPQHPSLVLLKYNQIASDFQNPMVRECRGIILDEANDWAVVCRAFDKIGNWGEGYADEIDWSTARVQEKLDGSLATLYVNDGKWHVATTGSPDAGGNVYEHPITFRELFWQTFNEVKGRLPSAKMAADLCFSFELMSPLNRIVVVHEKAWLRLLSIRHRVTGEQFPPETWESLIGIPAVQSFPLQSFDDITNSFATMNPLAQEGYVVVDGAYRRVKIKHPGYVALHHAKDGMTWKAFVEIARNGEVSEVVIAFPEFKPLLEAAKLRYEDFVSKIENDYASIESIPDQRSFAMAATKLTCSPALFLRRKGKPVREFLREIHIDKLVEWIGVGENDVSTSEVA